MPAAHLPNINRSPRRYGQRSCEGAARIRCHLAVLYGQLVDPRHRLMQLLQAFDQQFDTAFFTGKSYTDIRYREQHLDEQLLQWDIPRSLIQDICRFCEERYWRPDDTCPPTAG